jgi:phage tail tape-measure protein
MPSLATRIPRKLPGRIIRRLGRHPVLVVSMASLGVRMGRDAWRVKEGEIDSSEWRARAGSHVGSISGGLAGAAAGAVAFSAIPGIGPIVGGFAGGLLGEMGGTKLGRRIVERTESGLRGLFGTENAEAEDAAEGPPPEAGAGAAVEPDDDAG